DRHGQAQRPRSGSLSPRGADPHRRPPHLSHQRTAPLEHHLRCRSVHITCSWTLSKTVTSVRLHIAQGRDGLFGLIKSLPDTLKYEHDMIVAEGNLVIVHGRFSGFGAPASWIAADILIMEEGVLVEHWDVIEDEATRGQSKSGNPMFGSSFPG